MKKILIILVIFILCIIKVNAQNIEISSLKYETYDVQGNKSEGTLNFETTYIYDVTEL